MLFNGIEVAVNDFISRLSKINDNLLVLVYLLHSGFIG